MDISEYQNLNICAVRFKSSGEVLTAHQFGFWVRVNSVDSEKPTLEKIALAGADPVYENPPPSVSSTQRAEWDGAIQIDDKWYRNWKIIEDGEKKANDLAIYLKSIRQKRNELLQTTDWTVGNDSPLTQQQKEAWASYRQQLRDITKQPIGNIVWPTPPVGGSG